MDLCFVSVHGALVVCSHVTCIEYTIYPLSINFNLNCSGNQVLLLELVIFIIVISKKLGFFCEQ